MTFHQLALAIMALPIDQQSAQAGVWPPSGCPASEFVPVTGLETAPDGKPVISTGKAPTKEM